MITQMFYDAFTDEYVLETDLYAPPERYIKTLRGTDKYIDHWQDKSRKELQVTYSPEEYYSNKHDQTLINICKKENFKPAILYCFTLPENKFDEYVERFELKEN